MRFLSRYEPYAATILRVVVGLILFAHGVPKLLNVSAFVGFLSTFPWSPPPLHWFFGIGLIVVEVLGGLAIIAGFQIRLAAFVSGITYLLIAILVQGDRFILLFNRNSADQQSDFEFPFLIAIVCFSLSFLGPGRFRIRVSS